MDKKKWKQLGKGIKEYRQLLLMMVPAVIFFVVFAYVPMYGVVLAFKDFRIMDGILASPWAGLKYFRKAFEDPYFLKTIENTLVISFGKLIFGFPLPILFAVLLNELKGNKFKRIVQTVSYLPHFMSWVILGSIFFSLLSLGGPVNSILEFLGFEKIMFMGTSSIFRQVLICTDVWKGFGWGSVLYLAAIAGIDQEMYEAARVDGANRLHNIWYITLPTILPVICINLILNLSGILNAGFDQVFNMYSETVYDVADIIDTYVYRIGLKSMQYSLSTAVGLFKSVIGLVMIIIVNFIIGRIGGKENTLW
ncbi:ABC transporter permease [Eisenbergiella tayi]|uniref:ABC transporter permease n=1 Tax=Eisenbergiella tayi TaxID=1432052 RepID=UPI00084945FE|nr:ABC transporter permease subunit [Eisenbergiella tayi]ODR36287.1 protein lplB [Eisenbergiella tayi]